MDIIPLLGQALKSDKVIGVLEEHDSEVIYDFDRLNENVPDQYWVAMKQIGCQFRFDCNQTLDAVFLHTVSDDDYDAIQPGMIGDIPLIARIGEVVPGRFAFRCVLRNGGTVHRGLAVRWARIEASHCSIHYEYRDGALSLVTVMRNPPNI